MVSMDYNDYPEKLDEQVVEKLNEEYEKSNKVTIDNLSKDFEKISVQNLTENIVDVYVCIEKYLDMLLKLDRRHEKFIAECISISNKQKDVFGKYAECKSVIAQDVVKSKNFHVVCSNYFKKELELISLIIMLSAQSKDIVFLQLLGERVNIFSELFDIYTK